MQQQESARWTRPTDPAYGRCRYKTDEWQRLCVLRTSCMARTAELVEALHADIGDVSAAPGPRPPTAPATAPETPDIRRFGCSVPTMFAGRAEPRPGQTLSADTQPGGIYDPYRYGGAPAVGNVAVGGAERRESRRRGRKGPAGDRSDGWWYTQAGRPSCLS